MNLKSVIVRSSTNSTSSSVFYVPVRSLDGWKYVNTDPFETLLEVLVNEKRDVLRRSRIRIYKCL